MTASLEFHILYNHFSKYLREEMRPALESEHVVEAEGAVAAQQPVIAEEPARRIAHDYVGPCSGPGAGRFIEEASIVPQPGARTGNSQVRARNLAAGGVVEDEFRVARRAPRPG